MIFIITYISRNSEFFEQQFSNCHRAHVELNLFFNLLNKNKIISYNLSEYSATNEFIPSIKVRHLKIV